MALFIFTSKIIRGEPIHIFNNGHHSRDFTYIDDIVEGVVRTLDRVAAPNPAWTGDDPDPATSSAPYRLYNIGNNTPVPLMELIANVENVLGRTAEKIFEPMQPGDVPDTYADIDALVADVGFKPQTPINVGVERFVAWYKTYYGHN
jgi:UDP-glucuronate 4-epimerase